MSSTGFDEPAPGEREFDVVLYGATGFVGRLTARHLRAADQVRVALAGRDRYDLEAVRDDLDVNWPVLAVDLRDRPGVTALARSTRALASTVGPLDPLSSPGGVLTPAVAMGHWLVDRLIEQRFAVAVGPFGE